MATSSTIEWTQSTWNPLTGCTKISAGCQHCYAERLAKRLRAMGQPNYANGFVLTTHEHTLALPATWKKPQLVFVNSMSDLFHRDVPLDFIQRTIAAMRQAPQHVFQVLTKRSERLLELDTKLDWPSNVWVGVTVENAACAIRLDHLRMTHAPVRFVSAEPLLGPLPVLNLEGIDWLIAGGESGPGARPVQEQWILGLRDQCLRAGVAFFFKQWGGSRRKKNGRLLEGRTWDEMPALPNGIGRPRPSNSRRVARELRTYDANRAN